MALFTSDNLIVLRHVRDIGPIGIGELESCPPGSLDARRTSLAAQQLIEGGKLILDGDLKLSSRTDRCDRCNSKLKERDDARWSGVEPITEFKHPLRVDSLWLCRVCFNERLMKVFGDGP